MHQVLRETKPSAHLNSQCGQDAGCGCGTKRVCLVCTESSLTAAMSSTAADCWMFTPLHTKWSDAPKKCRLAAPQLWTIRTVQGWHFGDSPWPHLLSFPHTSCGIKPDECRDLRPGFRVFVAPLSPIFEITKDLMPALPSSHFSLQVNKQDINC